MITQIPLMAQVTHTVQTLTISFCITQDKPEKNFFSKLNVYYYLIFSN